MIYKVMLVDDEEEARSAIARKIDWDGIGFELVAEAENGEDALEKAEKYTPDVVMTDIHMPFMDGLELSKRLKTTAPGTRIVIFSGYDEFEYAKEAISLEVDEYILKPIDAEEVEKVFKRIKEHLDEEFDKRHNIERLEKYYQESMPLLREQLLIGILEGRLSQRRIERYRRDYQLSIDSAFYAVAVVEPDYSGEDEGNRLSENLLALSLKQLVDESLSLPAGYISLNYFGRVVVIGFLKSTQEIHLFVTEMDKICRLSKKQLDVDTVAGVGKVYGKLTDLSYSYLEAKDATMYKIMLDNNQAIYIGDVEPKSDSTYFMDEKYTANILREIKIGTKESLSEAVDEMVKRVKNSAITFTQLQLFFTEVVVEIIRLARAYQIELDKLYDPDIYKEIKNFNSLEDMGEWLKEQCLTVMDGIHRERVDSAKLLTEKTKDFLNKNYGDSTLSVDKVCNYLGVSATYFSSVFKKETGMSFVSYLTQLRLEEALNLLKTTEEKSYVIAQMVGYEEPNYFSYVFKKQYGVSPSKYRQSNS